MPYNFDNLPQNIEKKGITSEQFWQLRVHIDSSVLNENDSANKIEVIKSCVSEVFGDCHVDSKLFVFNGMDDEDYDGAMSPHGKDRTQLGKELCIILPDSDQEQMSAEEYKQKILMLWRLLQKNGIPLLNFDVPGDQAITIGDLGLSSPFSFTSNNPNKNEWEDTHGILLKKFEAYNQHHPILGVSFTVDELCAHGIELSQSLNKTTSFLKEHQGKITKNIETKLEEIEKGASFYATFIKKSTGLKDVITSIMTSDGFAEKSKTDREKLLKENLDYQLFLAYPHQNNGHFHLTPAISEINDTLIRGTLTGEGLDELIKTLKDEYIARCDDILTFMSKFPLFSSHNNLSTLVHNNPKEMQVIFRQNALRQEEARQNLFFLNQSMVADDLDELMKSVDDLIQALDALNDKSLVLKSQAFRNSLLSVQNTAAINRFYSQIGGNDEFKKNHAEDVGRVIAQHVHGLIIEASIPNFFRSILNACIRLINEICSQNIAEYPYAENEKVPSELKTKLTMFNQTKPHEIDQESNPDLGYKPS